MKGKFLPLLAALLTVAVWAPAANAAGGDIKWRFELRGEYVHRPPVVDPAGNIAVVASSGDVYSLTPQGTLRWTVQFLGGDGGPSVGADGTVYVASGSTITAIASNGSIRWQFTEPGAGGQGVIAGPNVGPDGNIYAVTDYGGIGAFALSPQGALLWSDSGNPTFNEYGQLGADVVFGSGRLYVAFDEVGVSQSTMYGLTLGGQQQWARGLGGTDDPFMQQQRQPATGADGSLYMTAMGGENGWSLFRINPDSGNLMWSRSPYPSNGMSAPSVGPDGTVYFSRSLGYLEAVRPAGDTNWTFFDGEIIDHPRVSPDGSIVVAGDRPDSACRGRFAAGTLRTERRSGRRCFRWTAARTRSSMRPPHSRPTARRRTSGRRRGTPETSRTSTPSTRPVAGHHHHHHRHLRLRLRRHRLLRRHHHLRLHHHRLLRRHHHLRLHHHRRHLHHHHHLLLLHHHHRHLHHHHRHLRRHHRLRLRHHLRHLRLRHLLRLHVASHGSSGSPLGGRGPGSGAPAARSELYAGFAHSGR